MTHEHNDARPMKSVILLSGGMDSTALAYLLRSEGRELYGLSIDYGQAHIRELQAAAWVADQTCKDWQRISVPPIFAPNALTGGGGSVVVPARNLVFLSLAYAYAISIEVDEVAIGVTSDDFHRFPDCRSGFMASFVETTESAMGGDPVPILRTPFILKTKREVVELGDGLSVPWWKTWSCYGSEPDPCGECLACQERAKALAGK